jgi:hypothetical protein
LIIKGDLVHEFFEEERHRCEVRQVLRWRTEDRNKAIDYLGRVRKARGDAAADKLARDCKEQWAKGNRGIEGDWR